jgi:pimeloyl-ACP methyl ester carboxylesterase
LKDFSVPILVITGDDDRIRLTAESVKLAGVLPGAKLAIIAQAGHVPQEEQPSAFMQALVGFVKTLL